MPCGGEVAGGVEGGGVDAGGDVEDGPLLIGWHDDVLSRGGESGDEEGSEQWFHEWGELRAGGRRA